MEIIFLENENKFIAKKNGETLGELTFQKNNNLLNFNHTFVESKARGLGVGQALVEAGASYAKNHDQLVEASCWYAKKIFDKNYPQLLAK